MTDEERQRTMDFILQQQAQFASDMQKVAERQAQFAADIEGLEESDRLADRRLARLENVMKLVIRAGLRERRERRQERERREKGREEERKEWLERINALIDAQMATEEIVRRNSEAIERNSEDIGRLSRIVERRVEGRNGGGKTEDDGEG